MRARLRDTELFFDIEGAALVPQGNHMREKPVAFLLHGGPGADHSSYKPSFSPLSQKLQLVYFDHRGQGRSARGNPATYTLDNNVEDMEALRQYLGLEQIVVIGGSYGGMVALTYASRYPERVSHLIVYATVPDFRFLARAQTTLAEKGTPEQQAIAQHLWQGTFRDEAHLREYFRVMAPLYSYRYVPNASDAAWSRTILSVDAINVAFSGFLRTYDVRSHLPNITAPTLVIGGRHDWICAPEFSEDIAALIPDADLRIFEQSGHSIRADEPEALLDAIAGFVVYQRKRGGTYHPAN
jgi:proline iminopeptidase